MVVIRSFWHGEGKLSDMGTVSSLFSEEVLVIERLISQVNSVLTWYLSGTGVVARLFRHDKTC